MLEDTIQELIKETEGSSDIEFEYETEEEYNNVMNLKKLTKEK
jgi:metal-dependent amidase/aminoacylase/carboxypeptidase family protein